MNCCLAWHPWGLNLKTVSQHWKQEITHLNQQWNGMLAL